MAERIAELEAAVSEHLERMAEGGWGPSDRILADVLPEHRESA